MMWTITQIMQILHLFLYHSLYDYTFLLLNSLDQETSIWYVAYPNHITGDDVVF